MDNTLKECDLQVTTYSPDLKGSMRMVHTPTGTIVEGEGRPYVKLRDRLLLELTSKLIAIGFLKEARSEETLICEECKEKFPIDHPGQSLEVDTGKLWCSLECALGLKAGVFDKKSPHS